MVWGCFGYHGGLRMAFVDGSITAERYRLMLQPELLPFAADLGGPNWQFQQDNARPHVARDLLDWLRDENVALLPWPSLSPDLNLMENVWAMLVRKVYSEGKQYDSVKQLKAAILEAADHVEPLNLQNLVEKMNKRISLLLRKDGAAIGY